jgi:hypothetical protein
VKYRNQALACEGRSCPGFGDLKREGEGTWYLPCPETRLDGANVPATGGYEAAYLASTIDGGKEITHLH